MESKEKIGVSEILTWVDGIDTAEEDRTSISEERLAVVLGYISELLSPVQRLQERQDRHDIPALAPEVNDDIIQNGLNWELFFALTYGLEGEETLMSVRSRIWNQMVRHFTKNDVNIFLSAPVEVTGLYFHEYIRLDSVRIDIVRLMQFADRETFHSIVNLGKKADTVMRIALSRIDLGAQSSISE